MGGGVVRAHGDEIEMTSRDQETPRWPMTPCPSEEQLVEYLLGTGQPSGTETIRVHIGDCARCREWLDDVQRDDDLMPDLRRVLDEDSDSRKLKSSGGEKDESRKPQPIIEGYDILEELGRGGMGIVYLALQHSTKRRVALKVLLEGVLASESAKRRFQREVELAAQLDHPNIVTVLESGIASGRYYCAMQYIEGRRLDHYVKDESPPVSALLKLFDRICRAVSHAHQRGVIHRDLKPSNIIIDGDGVPHVLDFGLAKQSIDDSTADAQLTQLSVTGQVMGTLPYMSPEQTAGNPREIDVRSDVYALGVILYEMLTGQFPYPVVGHIGDVLRHIVETAPRRPSGINRRIDDEIETILLKSLAKEPQRRYQSADALADDIECYLAGHPISAKRDSGWYVTRKLLRRYRFPFAAGLLILAVSVFSLSVYSGQRARIVQMRAADIVAASATNPAASLDELTRLGDPVRSVARQIVTESVQSEAALRRIMAVSLAPLLASEAFWKAIDGGPLWRHGEWLELLVHDGSITPATIEAWQGQIQSWTPKQRYVFFILIGNCTGADADDSLANWCAEHAANETNPGVASAAQWAAAHLGHTSPIKSFNDGRFVDPLTGLNFIPIPAADMFAPGSPADEPDRLEDEDHTGAPTPVRAFQMAQTETTWPIVDQFLSDPANKDIRNSPEMVEWLRVMEAIPEEQRPACAVGRLSRPIVERFCQWLNNLPQSQNPTRRYRLPTEIEWEYACRAGNTGRFCYGDDPKYLPLFARCNGAVVDHHAAGEFLPNFFGLYDMHGGLWEHTSTLYPIELIDGANYPDGDYRVIRGGAYYSPAVRCRSAQRNFIPETGASQYHGLRLVVEFITP